MDGRWNTLCEKVEGYVERIMIRVASGRQSLGCRV